MRHCYGGSGQFGDTSGEAARIVGAPDIRREAERVQAAAQVLLKNDGGLLPLNAGTRVYLSGIDGAAARAHGLTVVNDPAQADVALVRATTPYETLHPFHFFGSRQHEGDWTCVPATRIMTPS